MIVAPISSCIPTHLCAAVIVDSDTISKRNYGTPNGSFQFNIEPTDAIGSNTFTFTVVNEVGIPLTNFEYRVYVTDPAAGIIGSVELAGEEVCSNSVVTIPYSVYSVATNVSLQIIKDGYEELLVDYVLWKTTQSVTVKLITEVNI